MLGNVIDAASLAARIAEKLRNTQKKWGGGLAMCAQNASTEAHALAGCDFRVWDTQYIPASKALDFYRHAVCEVYMDWSLEFEGDDDHFQARIETISVRRGSITRHRCTPHSAVRAPADIANSPGEFNYLSLILSGGSECEQRGRTTVLKTGDIVVLDSARPARFSMDPAPFDALIMSIPKADLRTTGDADERIGNVVLKQNRTPLAKCLSLVAQRMMAASQEELVSLYDACLSLLPLEAWCFDRDEVPAGAQVHHLLPKIMNYIDQNVTQADLDPLRVAEQFGISVRYLHKLFIACGVTFSSFLTARRLNYISRDLRSPTCRRQPISTVALRWGFSDLSSFNRAFKRKYGCTPSQFRLRVDD
jgi:AraC-like DNA-binding protein